MLVINMNKIKVIKNNLKAFKNYRLKKIFLDNMPTYFWIEPTNCCNLQCIMCPTGAGKVNIEKGYMDFSFYKNIMDQIADFASAVTLAVNGESLLHPNFFDMVRYATGKGIKVLLNTNATLLDRERSELMLDSGLSYVSFAFDGFNKPRYENIRKGADFEKTMAKIIYFLKLRKKKNKKTPYTIISMLMLGLADCVREEKEQFLKEFKGLVNEIRLREVSTWGNIFKDTTDFYFRQNTMDYPPCSRLWSTAVISWNGRVLPCIYNANHEYVLGDLNKQRFNDIWNGEMMVALRRSMLNGSYAKICKPCQHCIVLGTSPICGIPSGIRLALSDSIINLFGYRFERAALTVINILRNDGFSSVTIN